MNDKRYSWTLYLIVVVILCTIGIQIYWNYKNYLTNKQQLINDVQISLDNAVDTYYADLAEKSTFAFAFEGLNQEKLFEENGKFSKLIKNIDSHKGFQNIDTVDLKNKDSIVVFQGAKADSILTNFHLANDKSSKKIDITSSKWVGNKGLDSLDKFKLLTSKVVISITNDTLQLKNLDSLLRHELTRKKIDLEYGLSFKNDSDSIQTLNTNNMKTDVLTTTSKSSFLPKKSVLSVYFENASKIILKRIFTGILISTLLVLAVISCLFYLLKIIRQQKQLAEVKNDLISNITHEFKTPIATIGVALESIRNFNVIDDKKKTMDYLNMSGDQLSKLNVMVEKLLETASLDSENLQLNKDEINIVAVLQSLVEKHQMQTQEKHIVFSSQSPEIFANVDLFHFENAINNILDNAIKYGGKTISITIEQNTFAFTVIISDDGHTLTKTNKDKIFEKFYRVPKGNTHDVKGFGIGLYYTKKIIEKHNGVITLDLKPHLTSFKIVLPNE